MPKNEKKNIERHSAEAFFELYNLTYGTDYSITEAGDAPDICGKDAHGNIFNLEITMIQDHDRGIAAALGRSNYHNISEVSKRIKEGKITPNCLQGNVQSYMINAISAKSCMDYGRNCGLLLRATSGVLWNWEDIIDHKLEEELSKYSKPFDRGIWLLSRDMRTIHCLHPGSTGKAK
jgi:hypothetical protein